MPDAHPVEEEEGKMRYKRRVKKPETVTVKTGQVFLGDEDKININKMNRQILDRLNIKPNKSFLI